MNKKNIGKLVLYNTIGLSSMYLIYDFIINRDLYNTTYSSIMIGGLYGVVVRSIWHTVETIRGLESKVNE